MRKTAVAIAALISLLANGQLAHGAARIARVDLFPSQPRVGQAVTIQLRPFWILIDGTLTPAVFPENYPWSVAAISPSGRPFGIRLARALDNPYLWRGTFRFRSRGLWKVCAATGGTCLERGCGGGGCIPVLACVHPGAGTKLRSRTVTLGRSPDLAGPAARG